MSTVVVYVHGLWQRGSEALWLRRRLARALAAEVRTFRYPSVGANAAASAQALAEYLAGTAADTVHLVGHSLGGVMIVKAFAEHAQALARLPPGRVVLLGSPLGGSRSARNLARLPFGKKIMGRAVVDELLVPHARCWRQSRDLGIVAGDMGVGLGRLVGVLGGASDGTIRVEETELDGAADRVVLRVSHTGMLFSAAVARAASAFLSTGRFRD